MGSLVTSPSCMAGRFGGQRERGFTLLELMIVVVVVAILAAIAIPSYESYIRKSRARNAAADLAALSLNVENAFRLKLKNFDASSSTTSTAATHALFKGWNPSTAEYFDYAAAFETDKYTLKATGKARLAGCTLTMQVAYEGATEQTASPACGFTQW